MTERRPTDAQIALALRAHVPVAPHGLRDRISASASTSPQASRSAWPLQLGGSSERPRGVLVAVALLVGLAIATALGAAAQLERQRRLEVPLSLEQPADLNAYVADAYAGIVDLPALRLTTRAGDIFRHDGSGRVRHDRPDRNFHRLILPAREEMSLENAATRAWVVQPRDRDPRLEIAEALGPWECPSATAWQYVGAEELLGRPTHHLQSEPAEGTEEGSACPAAIWFDAELAIPLRIQPNTAPAPSGAPAPSATTTATIRSAAYELEVVELAVGPQPPELFVPNPDSLPVMSAEEFACQSDAGACNESGGATAPPVVSPAPAPAQPAAPPELDAFVAGVHETLERPPAFRVVILQFSDVYGDVERQEVRHDGNGRLRVQTTAGGDSSEWLLIGERAWSLGDDGEWRSEGDMLDLVDLTLGMPTRCDEGWRHQGADLIAERPAHHLVCGLTEVWIDVEQSLVLRTTVGPRLLHTATMVQEVVEIEIGAQPSELFDEPVDADRPSAQPSTSAAPTP